MCDDDTTQKESRRDSFSYDMLGVSEKQSVVYVTAVSRMFVVTVTRFNEKC